MFPGGQVVRLETDEYDPFDDHLIEAGLYRRQHAPRKIVFGM